MGKVIKDTPHANGIDICIYTHAFDYEFFSLLIENEVDQAVDKLLVALSDAEMNSESFD